MLYDLALVLVVDVPVQSAKQSNLCCGQRTFIQGSPATYSANNQTNDTAPPRDCNAIKGLVKGLVFRVLFY